MWNTLHSSLMQGKALVLSVTWLHMLLIWVCFLTLSAWAPRCSDELDHSAV